MKGIKTGVHLWSFQIGMESLLLQELRQQFPNSSHSLSSNRKWILTEGLNLDDLSSPPRLCFAQQLVPGLVFIMLLH